MLVKFDLAFFVERKDIVRLGLRTIHPRRADRHSRNSKSGQGWFFFQKALDEFRGDVALNDVALDDGGMAGTKSLRNAEFIFDRIELKIRDLVRLDIITVFSQVTHPRDAATSGRAFVNRDCRPGNGYLRED
jgi:hypothetical protein